MGQFQSVQDPLGISRLVDQLNIKRKERKEQPFRDLQTKFLKGQVEQQTGQLSDMAAKRQETIDLKTEFENTPDQNQELTALNFYKKRNPKRAQELLGDIYERGTEIGKVAGPAEFAKYVNERTGQNFTVQADKGDLWKMNTGKEILVYNWRTKKIEDRFAVAQKGGETIETLPDGTVRITRGGAAKPKKYTEVQVKSGGFADRVSNVLPIFEALEKDKNFDPAAVGESIASSIPGAGNLMISENRQKYDQAKRDFITAVLRLESGAAINASEFVNEDKKYFPQPGDSAGVRIQKKKARERQLDILTAASGGFFSEIKTQRDKRTQTSEDPETGEVTTQEQFDKLPSGAVFIEDGKQYRKP